MSFLRDYNENDFLNSWKEDVKVTLDTILQSLGTCKRYTINSDVSNYLRYIDDEVFYVAPSFEQVKTNNKISTLNPHFILFSAPGATGKSCLAKHIAYTHNAIYWDTSKLKLGENTFDGSILKMVGAADYSRFTTDLKNGNTALVIDAFDEAEAISGRTAVQQFIEDLERCVNGATVPCVFMFSRTETAQFIASLCAENDIALQHYEIGFFEETQAVNFMEGQIENLKKKESAENVIRGNVMLGMVASRRESQPKQLEFGMIIDFPKDPELCFDRMYNVSIDAPNFTVCVGRSKADTSIHNSEIICKRIKWKTEHLLIEAKNPNGCLICTSEPSVGNPQRIEIVCDENLKVSMPDIAPYYKLLRYKYDFDDSSDIDIVKFTHALRCILVEFRSHSKDTLAKHIERIDNVVVGNNPIKQRVLAFMKDMGIVYEETHLYKIDTSKMQECKISFNGLLSMNFDQLEEGYRKFKSWDANVH